MMWVYSPDMTESEGGRLEFSLVFVNVFRCATNQLLGTQYIKNTYQIPSTLSNINHILLTHNPKHEIRTPKPLRKPKIQLNLIRRSIPQILQPPQKLKHQLEKIMTRSEDEDGMEGGDSASAGGEVEVV